MPVCMATAATAGRGRATDGAWTAAKVHGGAHCALRVAAPRHRDAEQRHDLVANELVHGPAVALHRLLRGGLDPAPMMSPPPSRIQAFAQRGVTAQIGE